jgi:transposase-like protein
LWLDALYIKVRQNHRIVSMAVVIAVGVKESGEREVLGVDIGASEDGVFWTGFLRSLVARGLSGVQLVTSDAHSGLKEAISKVLVGASWQRCRVHFTRNVLAHIPKRDKAIVAAAIRTIFAQPDQASAKAQLEEVAKTMDGRWSGAAAVLREGADDVLTYMSFPPEHWTRLYSTNPLERLNREVKRRTDVVGVFPDTDSVIRLSGSVLIELDDEWQLERRYFSGESMSKLYKPAEAATLEELIGERALQLAPIR